MLMISPGATEVGLPTFRVAASEGTRLVLFDARRIAVFVADHKLTRFYVTGREFLLRESLTSLHSRLCGAGFQRIHRNALVNTARVLAIYREGASLSLEMSDGSRHHVSRRWCRRVMLALGVGTHR